MAMKQKQKARAEARQIKAGKGSVSSITSAIRKSFAGPDPDALKSPLGMPVQPEQVETEAEQAVREAEAAPTVPAVVEVAKLLEQGWSEEVGAQVFDVWASGHRQADQALVLFVRDLQTGKLPWVVFNGIIVGHAQRDTLRAFVSQFKSKAALLARSVKNYYKGERPEQFTEKEWEAIKTDESRYLSIRMNKEGTACILSAESKADTGGSDRKADLSDSQMGKDYNRIADEIDAYCEKVGVKFANLPAKMVTQYEEILSMVLSKVNGHMIGSLENAGHEITTRYKLVQTVADKPKQIEQQQSEQAKKAA